MWKKAYLNDWLVWLNGLLTRGVNSCLISSHGSIDLWVWSTGNSDDVNTQWNKEGVCVCVYVCVTAGSTVSSRCDLVFYLLVKGYLICIFRVWEMRNIIIYMVGKILSMQYNQSKTVLIYHTNIGSHSYMGTSWLKERNQKPAVASLTEVTCGSKKQIYLTVEIELGSVCH